VRSETEDPRLVLTGEEGGGGNSVAEYLVRHGVLGRLLELFFEHHWNNTLHGLVESLVHYILDTEDIGTDDEDEDDMEVEEEPTSSVTILRNDLFGKADLLGRLQDAYALNDTAVKQEPRDGRLGFMGHLIRICGELRDVHNWTRLKRKLSQAQVLSQERLDRWETFMKGEAAKELTRQQILLGGHRPGVDTDEDDNVDNLQYAFPNPLSLNPNNFIGQDGEGDDDEDDDEFFDWGGQGASSEIQSYDYDSDEDDEAGANFNADFGSLAVDGTEDTKSSEEVGS
jgi:hypothetical protein